MYWKYWNCLLLLSDAAWICNTVCAVCSVWRIYIDSWYRAHMMGFLHPVADITKCLRGAQSAFDL